MGFFVALIQNQPRIDNPFLHCYLETMLTKQDLTQIRAVVRDELGTQLNGKLEEKLEEKLGLYPTKEQFFNSMDQIMTELKAIRQELTMVTFRSGDHEKRIGKLEKNVATN